MQEPFDLDLISNLNELHDLLLSEETLQATLERVARLASATLPGSDAVGVSLIDHSQVITAAATSDFTLQIDRDQYENREGPCLQAMDAQEVVLVEEIEKETRWPRFAEAAGEHGLGSVISFPLSVRDRRAGALNVYARSKNAFNEKSRSVGTLFASQASVALSNAQVYASTVTLAANLQEAIKTREIIGAAKGILMARERVSDGQAFEMLKQASQTTNVKLREIAQKVVDDETNKPD